MDAPFGPAPARAGPAGKPTASMPRGEPRPRPISRSTTTRLSIYLRCLTLLERSGVETISSQGLAKQFHLNSALIRKDLAYFGEFGVRGVGYDVRTLRRNVYQILGLDRDIRVIIIGAGNLGLALSDYRGFNSDGCHIVGMFDNSPVKVGTSSQGGVPVYHIDEIERMVREERVNIAVIAVPTGAAQRVLDRVTRAGVRAVLNFVPERLPSPEGIFLRDVDLKIQIEGLAFHLAHAAPQEPGSG